MAEEKSALREVHWRHVFPWLAIFRSFGVALDVKKLVLAAAGVVTMSAGWWILAFLFTQLSPSDIQLLKQTERVAHWPWDEGEWDPFAVSPNRQAVDIFSELQKSGLKLKAEDRQKIGAARLIADLERSGVRVTEAERVQIEREYGIKTGFSIVQEFLRSPFNTLWQVATHWRLVFRPIYVLVRPFEVIFHHGVGIVSTVFTLLSGLWAILVWGFFGGAITRIAAVQFAREEKIGLTEAIKFTMSKYLSYGSAPAIPLLFIAFFWFFCVIGGAISIIPGFGPVFASVLWFLPLLAGFVMAIILVGWVVGWPLMYSTISVEGSDSFDALSRSFAYVFQRPWHYLFYVLLAGVFGSICAFIVLLFADLIVHLANWAVSWGDGERLEVLLHKLMYYAPEATGWYYPVAPEDATPPQGIEKFAAIVTAIWLYVLFLLLVGFVYSYFWSAATAIYYLLRRDVDNTELQEVFVEGEAEDFSTMAEPPPAAPPSTSPPPSEPPPSSETNPPPA